jgi:hypothetical protein
VPFEVGRSALTETADSAPTSSPEDDAEEQEEARSVTELLEQLARELSVVVLCEAQLETSRKAPEVRRATRATFGGLVAAGAFLTGFAFVNVAALSGLSALVPLWLAALVLAAAWIAVGGSFLLGLLGRIRRWRLWSVFTARSTDAVRELEQARDAAVEVVRATLQRLGPAITVEIASAAVPMASGVASGVVDAGDALLEASDDIVEAIAEDTPGGSIVNQIWDVALMPGRFGIRVATTVLKRDTTKG